LEAVLKVTTKDVASKPATLGVIGTKIFYLLPGVTVYSTILQGNYPPYEEAMGIKLGHHFDCNTSELLTTLRRSMLVSNALAAFVFTEDRLNLNSATSSVGAGAADMEIPLKRPEVVEKIRVGFNPKYFKDALEAMTTKRCRMLFEGPKKAGILKEITVADGKEAVSDQFIYAVMPALLPKEA
jgi:DNA polymerase-3 subunit beta